MKPNLFLVILGALLGLVAGAIIALAVTPAMTILLAFVAAMVPFACLIAGAAVGIERVTGIKLDRRLRPVREPSPSDMLAEELKRIEDDMYENAAVVMKEKDPDAR